MVVPGYGLPGSGKSYFAERLAARTGSDYLNSDRIRKMLFPARTYSDDEKKAVYEAMCSMAAGRLKLGKTVVADATFHQSAMRQMFFSRLGRDNICLIEVTADDALIRQRLQHPRADSEADIAVYEKIRNNMEPVQEDHLVLISTNDSVNSMLDQSVDYLRQKGWKIPAA